MGEDRFKKISNDYAELFTEVFAEQGLDYGKFQHSVFDGVSKYFPTFKNSSILDIGTGDGETLAPFVQTGCINLTGIDLNEEMIEVSKKRFGSKVKEILCDVTNMKMFKPEQFEVITSGACIHNIPKTERDKFWKELLRLSPKVFVAAEKIVEPNPIRHKEYYDREVKAIIKVYKEKHRLDEAAKEWVAHYEYDERERLTLEEIRSYLSNDYKIILFFEMGMYKTIVAIKK